jgi:hypothetical protein
MLVRMRTLLLPLALGVIAPIVGACGSDTPSGPVFQNPATVRVQNELMGPVLFFRARPCGTTDWGLDLLPSDPIAGKIQPNESKDITVEAGCYDMQAQSLPTPNPSPELVTTEIFDAQVTAIQPYVWILHAEPDNPA